MPRWRRWTLVGLSSLAAALLGGLATLVVAVPLRFPAGVGGERPWVLLLLLSMVLLVVATALALRNQPRLEVRADGLEFVQLGFRVRTPWSNCRAVGYSSVGVLKGHGLLLAEPATVSGTTAHLVTLLRCEIRFIPLSAFGRGWREGELGREILRHAPHVVMRDE